MDTDIKGFFRTADSTYLGVVDHVEFSLDFEEASKAIKPEARRELADTIFYKVLDKTEKENLATGFTSLYFQSNGKNYVLQPKSTLALRIVNWFLRVFKIMKGGSKVEFEVVRSCFPSFLYTPNVVVNAGVQPHLRLHAGEERLKSAKSYQDPFTELSTTLFQDYEPFHKWKDVKDHPLRDASKYELCLTGNTLVAKPIEHHTVSKEERQKVLTVYKAFLYKEFGEDVIKRIQTHYEFDIDSMIEKGEPLTPEIVYRVNVGSSYIEEDDVAKLFRDLKAGNPLPGRLKRRVQLTKEEIQLLDIQKSEDFAKVMNILTLSDDEFTKIFTGRKLHGKISSWYTQADETLFKPWVDQQEFLQTIRQIPGRNWECFYEDLAMILCKKHLHQKNPDNSYRVGALIPAPRVEGKPQEYFKVTSWIHNSRGIYSYTLEPACAGSALSSIKLYRSTSLSPYNLDGAASYKNDFNPVNPPGYEGGHLLEKYEKPFFDKRTIPVWVGYQLLAEQKIASGDLVEAKRALVSANQALRQELEAKYKRPTLREFIREHDAEFLDLVQKGREEGVIGAYNAWYLLNNSLRNTVRYKYSEHSKEAKYLKEFLVKMGADELLTWWNWQERGLQDKETTLLTSLESQNDLASWSRALHNYAKEVHEDVESKTASNLDFVGHSLGAACAQRFLVYYTAAKGRIALPGHRVSAQLFDDPAINRSDNKTFIEFGNRHADLLAALQSEFRIVRRQEAGDPVPQSGDVHLGATKTNEQYAQARKWLQFDAKLHLASSKARYAQIRDYTSSHGRLFAGGITQHGWLRNWLNKKVKELEISDPEEAKRLRALSKKLARSDYKTTHFDSRTQWIFDHPTNKEIWLGLRKLWKLPFGFDPVFAERLRSYLSAFFRSGFLYAMLPKIIRQLGQQNPPDDKAHGDWKKICDSKGVFVVTKTSQK